MRAWHCGAASGIMLSCEGLSIALFRVGEGALALSSEMVGDAEHEEVGAIVGGDVAAVEGKLGEVIFVLEEGGD